MARKLDYNDEEGAMAKAQLQKIETYAAKLNEMINPDDELESWVQSKLSVVAAYMGDIKHYLDYELKKMGYGGTIENMYEVEFKFDSDDEDDYDSRTVQVYADTIEDAQKIATSKFSKLYKNFEIVEIEKEEYDYDDYEEEEYADGGKIGYGRFRQLRNDKPLYYNANAVYYQTYGELNDNGYNVDKGVAKVFKKTTGLKEIAYFKKDKDYKIYKELKDESGLITYIEFLDTTDYGNEKKSTISFILTDLYRKGGETSSQYRYQPSTLGEDMMEARAYLGEENWKKLSRDEKKDITNSLKMKGQIGIFGEEEDIETLSSLQYSKGGKMKK